MLQFKSKNVVLACGANQFIPTQFVKDFGIQPTTKVFTSDYVLKDDGYQTMMKYLRSLNGKAKISILGGSHSTFSVLYLLAYGPYKISLFDDFKRRQGSTSKSNKLKMPSVPKGQSLQLCSNCVSCPYGLTHSSDKKKSCMCGNDCVCISRPIIDLSVHGQTSKIQAGLLPEEKVIIIYRRRIKVHFSSQGEAAAMNYHDYNKDFDLSKGGIVYPFTGIRGDSKELWSKVIQKKLPNVSLVRADTHAD